MNVTVQTVSARKLAAVRRRVSIGSVGVHGDRRWTWCGFFCGPILVCAPMVTTCSFIITRRVVMSPDEAEYGLCVTPDVTARPRVKTALQRRGGGRKGR